MGLDQFAYRRKVIEDEKEDKIIREDKLLMRWRKHANLQGWMHALYEKKGGEDVFNLVELHLTREDLHKLEKEHKNLEKAEGFFWGESTDGDVLSTQEFVKDALKAIDNGYEIIYKSWW